MLGYLYLQYPELLIKVNRGNKLESEHIAFAVLATDAGLVSSWGDASRSIFSRSLIKPIQAKVSLDFIVSAGRKLSASQIAIASSSHYAEPEQLLVVDSILQDFSIEQTKIACGYKHNCSGKHSAILAACLSANLGDDYLRPEHKYNLALRAELERLGLSSSTYSCSDGCGLQTFYLSLSDLAMIFARLIVDPTYSQIITAMNEYPSLIAGKEQFDSLLMQNYPGRFIAKSGAEGLMMLANLETKQVLVLKLLDGAKRAKAFAAVHIIKQLGWIENSYNAGLGDEITNAQGLVTGTLAC